MAVAMDTTKVKVLGPAILLKDDSTILGHTTDDGVEVTYEAMTQDVMVDIYGDTAIDTYLTGEKVMVKAVFAQFDPEALSQVLVWSTYSGSGSPPLKGGTDAGQSGLAKTFELLVRPFQNHDAVTPTQTDDIRVWKAYATGSTTIPVGFKKPAKYPIEFRGLPDFTKTVGNLLFGIGANG